MSESHHPFTLLADGSANRRRRCVGMGMVCKSLQEVHGGSKLAYQAPSSMYQVPAASRRMVFADRNAAGLDCATAQCDAAVTGQSIRPAHAHVSPSPVFPCSDVVVVVDSLAFATSWRVSRSLRQSQRSNHAHVAPSLFPFDTATLNGLLPEAGGHVP